MNWAIATAIISAASAVLLAVLTFVAIRLSHRQIVTSSDDHAFNSYEKYHEIALKHPVFSRGICDPLNLRRADEQCFDQYVLFVLYTLMVGERILRSFRGRKDDSFAKGYIESIREDIAIHSALVGGDYFSRFLPMFDQQMQSLICQVIENIDSRERDEPMSKLVHRHCLISARIRKVPASEKEGVDWICRLIDRIGMTRLGDPQAAYSDNAGNKGLTISALITTSHITAHFWDEEKPRRLELDVYSCKNFDLADVLDLVSEFEPQATYYKFFDRSCGFNQLSIKIPSGKGAPKTVDA